MERISAARAMEWSIELEKGLRSKKPGQSIEAIRRIGPRLQQWSTEPSTTMAVSSMYGMVPGEDRTFANTILLRLADAFKCGDNYTKGCILKVFLPELRHIVKKGKNYNGILAKQRVPNYVELLKRVKAAFDAGDAEAKALALRLFGCWADLAKDSPQIRYIVLMSLQSSCELEVKASLFAASCFCLLSDDFSCITLKILIGVISSFKASADVVLVAIHAFSKMWCSPIASKAHEAGKKFVLGPLEEEFKAEMLSALSKLASKSTLLFVKQVDLLELYLDMKGTSLLKARALKCLYFLFSGASFLFPINRSLLDKISNIVDDSDLSVELHCKALQILRKIFCSKLTDLSQTKTPDLFNLIKVMEEAARSSFEGKKRLALHLLMDILCSITRARSGQQSSSSNKWLATCSQFKAIRQDVASSSCKDSPALLVGHAISLIIDHVDSLIKQMLVGFGDQRISMEYVLSGDDYSKNKHECKSLLSRILHLAEGYPLAGLVALDRLYNLINTVIMDYENRYSESADNFRRMPQKEKDIGKLTDDLKCPMPESKQILEFSHCFSLIFKFIIACLNVLDEAGEVTTEVCQRLDLLIECTQKSKSFDWSAYELFCMHFYTTHHYCGITNNDMQNRNQYKDNARSGFFPNLCWVDQEQRALDFAKMNVRKKSYWTAYRVGKYSCSKGLWFAATFTFRKLIDAVQSDSSLFWIKSLMLLSGGECEIRLLLFPKVGCKLLNELQMESSCENSFSFEGTTSQFLHIEVDFCNSAEKFVRVYSKICSSEKILTAANAPDGAYYFQRWFLSLRANVLQILVDIFRQLSSHSFTEENIRGGIEGNVRIYSTTVLTNLRSLIHSFVNISMRLNKIAREYDLLATSFLDIDWGSFKIISGLAFNCSLLSFCTIFTLSFASLPIIENELCCSLDGMGKFSYSVILQDLIERLGEIDSKMTTELLKFMTDGKSMDNLQARAGLISPGYVERDSILVCEFAISGIAQIQEAAKEVKNEELCLHVMRGLQHLSDIVTKWIAIPFKIPKYYFGVKPCIGAELFIFNADSRNTHEISVLRGFQLSLNLCIQLKYLSRKPRVQIVKLYCILATRPSDQSTNGRVRAQTQCDFNAHNGEEMVTLNELLLTYIAADASKANKRHLEVDSVIDMITVCVSFETNEKGQGFSSCLLDVSAFPEGTYQIRWHSCCIDSKGFLWSLLPLSAFPVFSIKRP